jgi:hypothetical protein
MQAKFQARREATPFIYLKRHSDNNSTTDTNAQGFRFDSQFDGNWGYQLLHELS